MSKITIDKFLVCDDVRCEVGGKIFLIGVYPGNTIALQNLPYVVSFTAYLEARCPENGKYKGTLIVEGQSGERLLTNNIGFVVVDVNQCVPLFTPLSFKVEKSQTYKLIWELEGREALDIGFVRIAGVPNPPLPSS
jgi:hypothetical protein